MNSLRKKPGRPCVRVRQYSVPGASGVTGLPLVGQPCAQEKYSEYYCICYWKVWKAYISSVQPSSGVGKCPRGGEVVGHSPTITHWSTLLLKCVCKCQSLALNSSTHASGNSIFDKFYLDYPSFLKVPCQFTDKRDSSERIFLFFRLYCKNICGGNFVILNAAYLRSSFIYVVIKPVFYSNQLSID